MAFRTEKLIDQHVWSRIADPSWSNPLDPSFAESRGGRWNAPQSYATLYLNEDVVTARINMRLMAARWPYEPEDLRPENAPVLVELQLPRSQTVADVHTPAGVRAAGLPRTYPLDKSGQSVDHTTCQTVGAAVHNADLRGIRCRSAQVHDGVGRELAWFPATSRSKAKRLNSQPFNDWYWS